MKQYNYFSPYEIEVNLTENLAPTDESLKLLKEIEYKTLEKIVHCGRFENNLLKDVRWFVYEDFFNFKLNISVVFEMNGEKIHLKSDFIDYTNKFEDILLKIREMITEKIFKELSSSSLNVIENIRSAKKSFNYSD